jgi:hypothetical protein
MSEPEEAGREEPGRELETMVAVGALLLSLPMTALVIEPFLVAGHGWIGHLGRVTPHGWVVTRSSS